MNTLFNWLCSETWRAWMLALAHSFWLGGLWAVLLWIILRKIPTRHVNLRYATALGSQILLIISVMIAWDLHTLLSQKSRHPLSAPLSTSSTSQEQNEIQFTRSGGNAIIPSRKDAAVPSAPVISRKHQWVAFCAIFWGLGAGVMGVRFTRQIVGLRRFRTHWTPLISPEVQAIVNRTARQLSIHNSFRILTGDGLKSPAVFGVLYPTLLLPASLITGTPVPQLTAIIAHELAHIRRFDYAVNLFQCFVEILLFFNPAVWWINQQIRLEREACCDAIAAHAIGCERDYAHSLLQVLSLSRKDALPLSAAQAIHGNAPQHNLLDRCKRILDPGYQPVLRLPWYSMLSTMILTGILFLGLWQGTHMVVAMAADMLVPLERMKRLVEIDKTNRTDLAYPYRLGEKVELAIHGRILTIHGSPPPEDTVVHASSHSQNSSAHYAISVREGAFQYTLQMGKIYLGVSAQGYAPLFLGPLTNFVSSDNSFASKEKAKRTQNEEIFQIPELNLVLSNGFEGTIKLVDSDEKAISGATIKGSYQHPASMGDVIDTITDENGIAKIPHALDIPVKLAFSKNGYQYEEKVNATLSPLQAIVWTVSRATTTTGQVLSSKTGLPVAGAEILLLHREGIYPTTYTQKEYAPVLATTDSQGRFILSNLNQNGIHTLWVHSSDAWTIVREIRAGQSNLKVTLSPKCSIHGIIRGDLNQLGSEPWTVSYSPIHVLGQKRDHSHEGTGKRVPVVKGDGEGFFDITDLDVEQIRITTGKQQMRVELTEENQTVTIKLEDPQNTPSKTAHPREVVVRFNVPSGSPGPKGQLVYSYVPKGANTSQQKSVDIRRHEARLTIEPPGTLSYYPKEAIGYWFPEKWGVEIPSGNDPFLINVPVTPAGAIHGSVVNADGSEADNILVSIVTVEKPTMITGTLGVEGKSSAKPNDGPTHFSIQPLPLNGKFAVVVYRDRCYVVSDVIHLTEQNPIQQLNLKMVKGIPLYCEVYDEHRKPLSGTRVKLDFSTAYSHGFSSDQYRITDESGRCSFPMINPDVLGYYSVGIIDLPGYRPVSQKVEKPKLPVKVFLEKAEILHGKAIHFETGEPIRDASFYLLPQDYSIPEITGYLNAEANSNAKGEFRFSNLARRTYNLHTRNGEIFNANQGTLPIMGGKDTNVIVRIKPR